MRSQALENILTWTGKIKHKIKFRGRKVIIYVQTFYVRKNPFPFSWKYNSILHPYFKKKMPESYQKIKTMMIFSTSKAFEWMTLKKIVFQTKQNKPSRCPALCKYSVNDAC